ncbi:MAG TPA: 1,4-alpha-glucan branching protein GlgB [Rhizomicrobium sp.]|nr:1,4-alpha-glucan branching protein GlgB [Rhizomicrobium sp.]
MPDREVLQPDLEGEDFWRRFMTDPFAARGPHQLDGGWVVRSFQPDAAAVEIICDGHPPIAMRHLGGGFFAGASAGAKYRLRIHWPDGVEETEDPYSFGPVLDETDLYLFNEGTHWKLGEKFGAVPLCHEGVDGVSFALWAPNARRVSLVGDFNNWDGRRHPMRLRHIAGVWDIFLPRLKPGARYKYEIEGPAGLLPLKADPIARATEPPPATASIVAPPPRFEWHDEAWMESRAARQRSDAPISIYEVHAASWMRPQGTDTGTLNWDGLTASLIPYVKKLGFTHLELMPIMEHPFFGSWGYQPLSQFAPSARYGSAADFARFVDACHRDGIGVILDWVPAHFPNDAHGLALFDGTALYEHTDPREGFHPDWNTCVYNLGRSEVQGFLIASGLWWLETFHADGLRVDAVASMLYRDYSRRAGEWIPNRYGGRENLEAIDFLKRMNGVVAERCPGAITVAEESTAWPGVSTRVEDGGLGFSFKWNMGWMHDTLRYIGLDPIHRRWHHNDFTFGLLYAFSERFVLPLSHDEVVHGKGSLYGRVPGDPWRKLATLRAYFAFMWTHPGKKLLFMGGEFAQQREWNHDGSLDWELLDDAGHHGMQRLVTDLNALYRSQAQLYRTDADPAGFRWLVADDADNSVFAFARGDGLLTIINMTPVPRAGYRIGVPLAGRWQEILNTDSAHYGGGNIGNLGALETVSHPSHGFAQSLILTLPPLAALILKTQD